mgnify:CR=1 FL=1
MLVQCGTLGIRVSSGKMEGDDFLKFDYIGAPWNERLPWIAECGLKLAVGNGGFSLRTKQTMLNAITKFPRDSKDFEDVYFSRCIYDNSLGLLPSFYEAATFSSEAIPHHASFGGHCFFNYDIYGFQRFIRECIIPILQP